MPKLATQANHPALFAGFPHEALQFFHELAAEMNKEWFTANKARYEALWVAPMTALLGEVAGRLAKPYAPIKLGEPSVMRIYRDVRFSKDKSPYKTHIGGVINAGPKKLGACSSAMYLHIGLDDEFIGVGSYMFDPKKLVKWRKLVAGKPGERLASIIAKLRKGGYTVGGHDDYKNVPKPFAPDHPRGELLKMKGLTAGFPEIPRGLLHKPAFGDWLVDHAKATVPLVAWLHEQLG